MSVVAKVRKVKEKLARSEDIQELRKQARKIHKKLASEEFQTELEARRGIGSPFEVKVPKKKARKPTVRRETKAKKQPSVRKEPKTFVKRYTKRSPATKKYRVESKIPESKLNRRWFASTTDAKKYAERKASAMGVKVTNVQRA